MLIKGAHTCNLMHEQAHAGSTLFSCTMWRRALRALDVGVEAATSPTCMVPLPARLELVNTINQLYTQHR